MTALSYTDIQQGVFFRMDGAVYETVDAVFSKKSRQKGSNQVRIKNIATGAVTTKTFHTSDVLEDVTVEKEEYVFVYARNDEIIIHPVDKPSERTSIPSSSFPNSILIPSGTTVTALVENNEILTVRAPIKVDVLVKEAPPDVRGNTAQGGTKRVVTETGASIATPLFIKTGDCIRINTETGEYTERVKIVND